jgi:hypothetical protein
MEVNQRNVAEPKKVNRESWAPDRTLQAENRERRVPLLIPKSAARMKNGDPWWNPWFRGREKKTRAE